VAAGWQQNSIFSEKQQENIVLPKIFELKGEIYRAKRGKEPN